MFKSLTTLDAGKLGGKRQTKVKTPSFRKGMKGPTTGPGKRRKTMAKWVARAMNKKVVLEGEVRSTDNKTVLAKAKEALTAAATKGKISNGKRVRVAIERDGEKHDEWTMVARANKPKKSAKRKPASRAA